MPAPGQIMQQNTRTRQGSMQYNSLKSKIQSAMGPYVKVTSVTYLGRDALGKPIYRISSIPMVHSGFGRFAENRFGKRQVKTVTWDGKKLGAVNTKKGTPESGAGDDNLLTQAKDKWFEQIAAMNLPDPVKQQILRSINNFRGSPAGLTAMVDQMLSMRTSMEGSQPEFDLDSLLGGLGGGGGGGFAGPEYRAPDRRVVEDFVKGTMISLLGKIEPGLIDPAVNLYMKDHRRNFDSVNAEIDPAQSVLEFMRDTDQYLSIHELRPDSVDERTWVSDRRQAAAEGGLNVELQEDFAIEQATVGGDVDDVQVAAGQRQFEKTGSLEGTTLESRLLNATASVFDGVII